MGVGRYGGDHQAIRKRMLASAVGSRCVRCGRVIRPGQPVDLDHADDGSGRYLGWSHASCNRRAGAKRGVALRRERERRRIMEAAAFGVEISVDRMHTSVVRAGRIDDDRVLFELCAYLDGSDTAAAVAAELAKVSKVVAVVIDERSPAATLLAPLEASRVTVTRPTTHQVAVAHGRFVDEMRAGRLRYREHPALTLAVQHAQTRRLGGGEAVERYRAEADVAPLTAAELAVWGLVEVPPAPVLYVEIT